MAQRLLIKWKHRPTISCWEGTVKGDSEPLIFIEGGLCVTDLRESRKSGFGENFIPPKRYKTIDMTLEERKQLAEDLVTGANFEKHEANRLEWERKNKETADLIASTDELIKRLKKQHEL